MRRASSASIAVPFPRTFVPPAAKCVFLFQIKLHKGKFGRDISFGKKCYA
jgi:hypothetical protein